MGTWEPPKGMAKVNMIMRVEFHRRINVLAAESGQKPWQILDAMLEKQIKIKKPQPA